MRISIPSFLYKLPNGNIFIGKRRVVKRVTKKAIQSLSNDLALEERNMFYLRHPFLTNEQVKGHAAALHKHERWLSQFDIEKNKKFAKHRSLKSELSYLKINENWEFTAGSEI